MLCQKPAPGGRACGACPACYWLAEGNHPDYRLIAPESEEAGEGETRPAGARASAQIRIHQVRALQDWLSVGSHQGGVRVALISPAEAMNAATANALLKTLEEPPPGTILVLVSHRPGRLLATLRSRCQSLGCRAPGREQALQWLRAENVPGAEERLALCCGAPLAAVDAAPVLEAARALAGVLSHPALDVFESAGRLARFPMPTLIDLFQKWAHDLRRAGAGIPPRYFAGSLGAALAQAAALARAERLPQLESRLMNARRLAEHPLNPRLVLEDLLAEYREAQRTGP